MDIEEVVKQLNERGWFLLKNYCTNDQCNEMQKTLITNTLPLNNNDILPFYQGGTKFNTNILGKSKVAFKAVTSKYLRKLAENFLEDEPLLKCIRSYAISRGYPLFKWHADNVNPITFETDSSKGLNGIIYLQDDYEMTFWLADKTFSTGFYGKSGPKEKDVKIWEKNNKIIKIKAKKGDLVLFRQDIFHRHITEKYKHLCALWFQIISHNSGTKERVLINPSFLEINNNSLIKFLGAETNDIGYSNPYSKIYHLPAWQLLKIGISCILIAPFSFLLTGIREFNHFMYFKTGINLSIAKSYLKKSLLNKFRNSN